MPKDRDDEELVVKPGSPGTGSEYVEHADKVREEKQQTRDSDKGDR